MKILYAVQATGNGHISRAKQLLPYLQEYGEVDIFLSGSNATLNVDLPIKYRSKGLSLFYKKCGGLNYRKMVQYNSLIRAVKESYNLPVDQYDLVINDFEFITARACKIKKKESVHFGHQASFLSSKTPRPKKKSRIGEWIFRDYAPATHKVGLHFLSYDEFILPPVIKSELLDSKPVDQGHISIYLPSYEEHCLRKIFQSLDDYEFHWFLPNIKFPYKSENIHYFPIDNDFFSDSLIHCQGLITGGGFETPAEALYLNKKLMCIPIKDHYEQKCNAAAIEKLGVKTLEDIDCDTFAHEIIGWLQEKKNYTPINANNVKKTIATIINKSVKIAEPFEFR